MKTYAFVPVAQTRLAYLHPQSPVRLSLTSVNLMVSIKRKRSGRHKSTLTRRMESRGRSSVLRAARAGQLLSIEKKFYDQKLINAALTSPADATGGEHNPSATISLNTVVQGDGESNRDGRQIVMKSVTVKGNILVPAQTTQTVLDVATTVFIALVQDTQTNGALLNSEDVFTNPGANAQTATQVFRNLKFIKRFKVLKVVQLELPQPESQQVSSGAIVVGGYQVPWSLFKSLANVKVNYSSTSESIVNIVDNGLNIVAWCSNTSTAPAISYHSRLRFLG